MLLVLVSIVGVVTALAAWCFLELSHQIEVGVFEKLPEQLGYDSTPAWWPLPVTAIGGLIVAFAVVRLPGGGGHVPAHGLDTSTPTLPIDLPGVMLAALATIGLGLVLGPEAPLIALGAGLGIAGDPPAPQGRTARHRDAGGGLRDLLRALDASSARR